VDGGTSPLPVSAAARLRMLASAAWQLRPVRQALAAAAILSLALFLPRVPGSAGRIGGQAEGWALEHDVDPNAVIRALADGPVGAWLRGGLADLGAPEPGGAAAGGRAGAAAAAGAEAVPGRTAPSSAGAALPTGLGPLALPVDGPVVSRFGWRTVAGRPQFHPGLDFRVPAGLAVHAVADGVVSAEGVAPGVGFFVRVSHASGWQSEYGHCGQATVRPGARVRRGGTVCLTTGADGPEGPVLHFELQKDGHPVDPAPYLGLLGGR
jgi:murein DD-endopeptidase MepM/ murein hydrolase activator NlpD